MSIRCSSNGCSWTGKLSNDSETVPQDKEFWINSENWSFLPKNNALLHTCQGFSKNEICQSQLRNFTKKKWKREFRTWRLFKTFPVWKTNFMMNYSTLLAIKKLIKELSKEKEKKLKMEKFQKIWTSWRNIVKIQVWALKKFLDISKLWNICLSRSFCTF